MNELDRTVWSSLALLLLGCASLSCQSKPSPPLTEDATGSVAPATLRGEFVSVAKPATGRAEIVRQGDDFTLHLHRVRVDAKPPVRVYLVGVDSAPDTRTVVEARLQYDMAELDQTKTEQVIKLPSEPDPELRSVVLWEPSFGVNLASASLSPVE